MSPGNPVVAVAIVVALMAMALLAFRALARTREPTRNKEEAEDVAELDVFFVCGECGTEFRVERIGELQVPRHCGEPMRVERRTPGATPG